MALTADQVRKIAFLSRIDITEKEVEHFQRKISSILQWVEQLQQVDTRDVPPMSSVEASGLTPREDIVTDGNCQEDILRNAPHAEFGCFVVPKVVDQD